MPHLLHSHKHARHRANSKCFFSFRLAFFPSIHLPLLSFCCRHSISVVFLCECLPLFKDLRRFSYIRSSISIYLPLSCNHVLAIVDIFVSLNPDKCIHSIQYSKSWKVFRWQYNDFISSKMKRRKPCICWIDWMNYTHTHTHPRNHIEKERSRLDCWLAGWVGGWLAGLWFKAEMWNILWPVLHVYWIQIDVSAKVRNKP